MLGLDVLRSLAIVGVLLFHADLVFWGGRHGWTRTLGVWGVELFFVLSGFLIGGLLMDIVERGMGPRSWGVFMVRRWMRTVPLYLISLAVFAALPGAPALSVVAAYALFAQNLAWSMITPWFPVSWSLSIEEWFYLLFSALVLALVALRVRRNAVLLACLPFLLLPLLARWWVDASGAVAWDDVLRRVTLLRMDAIAYGVLMGWAWRHAPATLRRLAGWGLLLAAVLLTWVALFPVQAHPSVLWRGAIFALISSAFALCLPAAMQLPSLGCWPNRGITWLSERSYGLYITHLPIMEVGRHAIAEGWVAPRVGLLGTALAMAVVAELCFRCIEQPFLRRRPPQFER